MTRKLAFSLVLAICLALAATASAAKFTGKTEANGAVNFSVSGGKVKKFQATVFLICLKGTNHFDAVIPPKAMKVGKGGKFKYVGEDKQGNSIEVHGKVKGKKATGVVSMVDSYFTVSDGVISCTSGDRKFTAKVR